MTDKTFLFELVSPERVIASEQASMVVVPGAAGEFGVMAGHIPLLSSLRAGVVAIHLPSGEVKRAFVTGGFADVTLTECSILVDDATNLTDIKRTDVEDKLKKLEDDLLDLMADKVDIAHIQEDIMIEQEKLRA